jgi:pimeloyl-ACP methyl ester carboxylesterase
LPPPRRRPDPMVAVTFLAYALPGIGELYMRMTQTRLPAAVQVRRVIDLCFGDPSRADPGMLAAATALAEHRGGLPGKEESFLRASRSLIRILALPQDYRAMMRRIDVPVLLFNGTADRLVPIEAARQVAAANPTWQTEFLPGVGHTPQLETPELVITAVTEWLAKAPINARG